MSDPAAQGIPPEPRHDEPQSGGQPLLATLIGGLVILLPLAAPPRGDVTLDLASRLGALTGHALFAVIVWGVCYAITIKRASRGWKIASLAIMILLGLVVGLIMMGRQGTVREDEAKTLSTRLKALANADPQSASFEAGAGAGPMTRLTAAGAAPILADTRRLAAAQKAAGLDQLLALDGLTHRSPVLDHCDKVAALAPITAANGTRFPVYLDAVRKEGDAIVAAGEARRSDVDAYIQGMSNTQEKFVRQSRLATQIAEGGAELCDILARRNWTRGADGKINFTSSQDLAAAQAVQVRLDPQLAEFNAARRAGVAGLDDMPAR